MVKAEVETAEISIVTAFEVSVSNTAGENAKG